MSRCVGVFVALALAITSMSPGYSQVDISDVIERCEKSVVRIAVKEKDGSRSEGSGFVVAPNTIATNVHVLMGAKEAEATFPRWKEVYDRRHVSNR